MEKSIWRYFDLPLFLATMTTAGFGVMMVYSAIKYNPDYASTSIFSSLWAKQLLGIVVGMGLMYIFARLNYHVFESFNLILYIVLIASLAVVAGLGLASHGAIRWINFGVFEWQPSETAKVLSILILARFYATNQHRVKKLTVFLFSIGLVAPAIGLVFLQPDLGTSLVLMSIWLLVTWCAGSDRLHLLTLILLTIPLVVVIWNLGPLTGGKIQVFKDYQEQRLSAFVDPQADPGNTGYQLLEGQKAIINGGLLGEGYTNGTGNRLNLIPERHTDFIFSVIGEEFGFAGSLALLCILLLILLRVAHVATIAYDAYGRNICIGVMAMLAFQILINIGMTVGLAPVAGIPLPLVSYGLSSCWTTFIGLGLVESVAMRHRRDIAWYYRVGPSVE